MDEQYFEKLLNIKTSGEQRVFYESMHYNRYEPTSYSALEILCEHYKFTEGDGIVDFGCGKGRLNFYLNHFFQSKITGIEMNKFFCNEALANKRDYSKKHKSKNENISFLNCTAEKYNIDHLDNKFYFFNPFSIQIFIKVVGNILISKEEYDRTVDIILYYPSEDYICFLENKTPFVLFKEIKLPYLYDRDPRQAFLIYRYEKADF